MKQYQKLLMSREAREVLGKRWINLWLLLLMLMATFASIAFSEGSMNYLRDKMADPYTNWVSISKLSDDRPNSDEEFNAFRESLNDTDNMERFDYRDVLISQSSYYDMIGMDGKSDYLSARFFEHLNTPLFKAVLKETVDGCQLDTTLFSDETMGLILTLGAAKRLGYDEDNLPAYISFRAHCGETDSLKDIGVKLDNDEYVPVALPVLAVVRRLPNNVQMLSSCFLFEQLRNGGATEPFDFSAHKDDYLRQLAFYVADEICDEFKAFAAGVVPDSLEVSLDFLNANDYYRTMRTWKSGTIWTINIGDGNTPLSVFQQIANDIEEHFNDYTRVCRVFNMDTKAVPSAGSRFLSVEFKSLSHIGEFEEFAKEHKIQLELEKVHSMQNFMAVTDMARVLSAAMVIFSIVCIIMFMVNMLQSYFQRVKRNIGTFKAFGMDGQQLVQVYVLLLVMIVSIAVLLALLAVWGVQGLLPTVGFTKDGFNYFDLWNSTTSVATAVIFLSTVCIVVLVMVRMLSRTPGDLIYDRN